MKSASTPVATAKESPLTARKSYAVTLTQKQAHAVSRLARFLHSSPEDTLVALAVNTLLTGFDPGSLRADLTDAMIAADEDRVVIADGGDAWCIEEDEATACSAEDLSDPEERADAINERIDQDFRASTARSSSLMGKRTPV